MKKFTIALLGSVGLMAASNALAADISAPVVVPGPVVVVPPPAAPGYNWTGFYVGVQGGVWREPDFSPHSERVVGQAGYDLQIRDHLVVGAVAQAGVDNGFSNFTWSAGSRAGVVLGERVLVFGTAQLTNGPNLAFGYILAGGTEVAIGRHLSLVGEAGIYNRFGGGDFHILLSGGLNLRFGG